MLASGPFAFRGGPVLERHPMNIKSLTALVGTLSLGALATGCASTKAAMPAEPSAPAAAASTAPAEAHMATPVMNTGTATPTAEKAAEHNCGAGGCGTNSCGGKK